MKPNTPVTHIAAALLAVPAQATETENQPPSHTTPMHAGGGCGARGAEGIS